MSVKRRLAIVDVLIVAAIEFLYVQLETGGAAKRWSLLAKGVSVLAFGVYVARRRTDSWRDLGFRTDNLRAGLVPFGACTAVFAAAILLWAHERGRNVSSAQLWWLLALYPAWALAQQFMFQSILHRRLMVLVRPPPLQIALTALCFGAIHFGSIPLVLLSFFAGFVWSFLFRKWPNVWLLTASHSILAALVYVFVIGDAPLTRL